MTFNKLFSRKSIDKKFTLTPLAGLILSIIGVTIGSLSLFFLISPAKIREAAVSSQGIRLVNNTVIAGTANDLVPQTLRIGSLLLDKDDHIFRVMEIRKTNTNTLYVAVAWKKITNYQNYERYDADPYTNFMVQDLTTFTNEKSVITESIIREFYTRYMTELENNQRCIPTTYGCDSTPHIAN